VVGFLSFSQGLPLDSARAKRISAELQGARVGAWTVEELISNGNSAVVLRATRDGAVGALKVFDPDIVDRFGRAGQLERINRETTIGPLAHPNLVPILDGGECPRTGYLYVVMELLHARPLSEHLLLLPRERIRPLVSQVAAAAQYLETLHIAHRDIKPSNVVVTANFSKATLLDLGVLRPIGQSDITDESAPTFIGTLQYGPPEFLLREEEDSVDGWRAVTFYQLGGLLHDLIMRRPLFWDRVHPYPRLVKAISEEEPSLAADDVDPDLILLAQNCLAKKPAVRLRLVAWHHFREETPQSWKPEEVEARIRARHVRQRTSAQDRATVSASTWFVRDLTSDLQEAARNASTDSSVLLRATVVLRATGPNGVIVQVQSPADPVVSLAEDLYFLIYADIFDAESKVVALSAAAAFGRLDADSGRSHSIELYRGSYDERRTREKLRHLFLFGLDMAQERSYGSPSADPSESWLPIEKAFGARNG
jgi:serine/threonine protein kinase